MTSTWTLLPKDMLGVRVQGSRFLIRCATGCRNTEIDAAGEVDASFALREIPRTLNKIRKAVNMLNEKGFNQCVIATDHGFHLRTNVEPGFKV